jgi:hypothetical protein
MKISYPLFEFKAKAIALSAAAIIIMVVLLAANVTITNAQQQQQEQQQQLSTSQPSNTSSVTQNGTTATTTLFESTNDSFRVQLPEGWVIQDVNNTGFALAAEVTEGYGVLAQLCPEGEEGQQQGALTNVSSSSSSSCQQQQAQEEIIHIIRYPNLGTRLGIAVDDINDIIPNSILEYQIQKLQEVGYRDINLVNSTNATININYTTPEDVPVPLEVTVPARLVEVNYSTSSAPSEMRRGYFILTATNVTPPNPETITGYSIFYEGALGATAAEQTTTPSGNLLIPASLRQVFDSFELIASEEAVQALLGIIAQQAAGNEPNDQVEEDQAGEEAEDDDEEAEDDDDEE